MATEWATAPAGCSDAGASWRAGGGEGSGAAAGAAPDRAARPARRKDRRRNWLLLLTFGAAASAGAGSAFCEWCRSVDAGILAFVSPPSSADASVGEQHTEEEGASEQTLVKRVDIAVVMAFAFGAYSISRARELCRCQGAPRMHKVVSLPPTPAHGALLIGVLYGSNIAYNVMNKRVLILLRCPALLTTVNLGACSFCCAVAWAVGVQRRPAPLSPALVARIALLALLHWLSLLTANVSVAQVNLVLAHTVKAAEPTVTAVLMLLFQGAVPSPTRAMGLLLICVGVSVASAADVSFAWPGVVSAMLSNVAVSFRTILSKRLIAGLKEEDPLNVAAFLNIGALTVSLPFIFFVGKEPGNLASLVQLPNAHLIPFIGVLVWVFNMASIIILSRATPVTHSVIRSMRRPVLILSSILAFGTEVPWLNAAGILCALLGAWFCTSTSY